MFFNMANRKKGKKEKKEAHQENKKEEIEITEGKEKEEGQKEPLKEEKREIDKKISEKMEKEIKILLVIMIIAFVLFFVFIWISKTAAFSFKYEDLKFRKEAYGNIIFYHTQINIARPDGRFVYDLYLRNDPRKLEKIPANFSVMNISMNVVASFAPEVDRCPYAPLAGVAIGNFFSALKVNISGATADADFANSTGKPFVTCENAVNQTIIEFRVSNESSIKQENTCYIINVKNCEVLETTERFVLSSFIKLLDFTNSIKK